jgi:hypothetical protein
MSIWLRITPEEGNAIHTAAEVLREYGYLAKADSLDQISNRWSKKQDRRWRILAALHLDRFA